MDGRERGGGDSLGCGRRGWSRGMVSSLKLGQIDGSKVVKIVGRRIGVGVGKQIEEVVIGGQLGKFSDPRLEVFHC